ncbi:uncharacterized protein [Palaemon carinicauda]|uniref:uncharacterized protein n=1 Tax=Palaemon carinicauda TaxID=392227 RepID=UPI0035B5A7A3
MIGGDLNGHVERNGQALERIRGGWALGDRNQDGKRVMDFAIAFDMTEKGQEIKKRHAKKRYDETGTAEDKERSRLTKKEAKVAVGQSKQQGLDNGYEDLDTKEGQKKIYKIDKGRNKATKDITYIK